jgi:acid phosphatase (class A)
MKRCLILGALSLLATTATAQMAMTPDAAMKVARTSMGPGYLPPGAIPDPLLMLPPPPPKGSAALARDREAQKVALALRGSPRWDLATADAELLPAASTGAMSCAAGFVIGEKETPAIQHLLRRVTADLGASGAAAKRKYMRPRPFMANNKPSCTPDWEPILRKDGSYPSGHSAVGYGWGLILAEIVPDRAAQLVARGRAYGDSRRICNVHWLSDVEEGRVTGTAVVARLHAEPAFRADVEAARAEVEAARANPVKPDCAKETAVLATSPEKL